MKCIVWLLDSGVERFFATSLGSLRENGRSFWDNNIKLVLDFGLSEQMVSFLSSLKNEGVHIQTLPLPNDSDVVGGNAQGGVGVMRRRVEVTDLIPGFIRNVNLNVDSFIVCDTDTVFFNPPDDFPLPTESAQISIMKEWDNIGGSEIDMRLYRPSSFSQNVVPEKHLPTISSKLGLAEDELRELATYNTGVFGFREGSDFTNQWETEYALLKSLLDDEGRSIFSPYAAEQNAMSLCIHKQIIQVSELPRRFNQFPPRPPQAWPTDTVIAHFMTFKRNHNEARYRPWYEVREQVKASRFVPEDLLS
jgi:hypothetical protein